MENARKNAIKQVLHQTNWKVCERLQDFQLGLASWAAGATPVPERWSDTVSVKMLVAWRSATLARNSCSAGARAAGTTRSAYRLAALARALTHLKVTAAADHLPPNARTLRATPHADPPYISTTHFKNLK